MSRFEFALRFGRAPLWLRRFIYSLFYKQKQTVRLIDWLHQFKIWSRSMQSRPASKNEIRRWLLTGNVWINGEKVEVDDMLPYPNDMWSVVLFPKGQRITLW